MVPKVGPSGAHAFADQSRPLQSGIYTNRFSENYTEFSEFPLVRASIVKLTKQRVLFLEYQNKREQEKECENSGSIQSLSECTQYFFVYKHELYKVPSENIDFGIFDEALTEETKRELSDCNSMEDFLDCLKKEIYKTVDSIRESEKLLAQELNQAKKMWGNYITWIGKLFVKKIVQNSFIEPFGNLPKGLSDLYFEVLKRPPFAYLASHLPNFSRERVFVRTTIQNSFIEPFGNLSSRFSNPYSTLLRTPPFTYVVSYLPDFSKPENLGKGIGALMLYYTGGYSVISAGTSSLMQALMDRIESRSINDENAYINTSYRGTKIAIIQSIAIVLIASVCYNYLLGSAPLGMLGPVLFGMLVSYVLPKFILKFYLKDLSPDIEESVRGPLSLIGNCLGHLTYNQLNPISVPETLPHALSENCDETSFIARSKNCTTKQCVKRAFRQTALDEHPDRARLTVLDEYPDLDCAQERIIRATDLQNRFLERLPKN